MQPSCVSRTSAFIVSVLLIRSRACRAQMQAAATERMAGTGVLLERLALHHRSFQTTVGIQGRLRRTT
jgi:hypothetical protein